MTQVFRDEDQVHAKLGHLKTMVQRRGAEAREARWAKDDEERAETTLRAAIIRLLAGSGPSLCDAQRGDPRWYERAGDGHWEFRGTTQALLDWAWGQLLTPEPSPLGEIEIRTDNADRLRRAMAVLTAPTPPRKPAAKRAKKEGK